MTGWRFTIADLLILSATAAFTARALAGTREEPAALVLAASLGIGGLLAGPALVTLQWRRRVIRPPWGVGEVTWLALGLCAWPAVIREWWSPALKAPAYTMALLVAVWCAALLVTWLALVPARTLTHLLGGQRVPHFRWAVSRWTNRVGLALVVAFALAAVGFVIHILYLASLPDAKGLTP